MAARLLRLDEAADANHANCHRETLRRAIMRGELLAKRHPTKRGHPLLIDPVDLASFLAKRARV